MGIPGRALQGRVLGQLQVFPACRVPEHSLLHYGHSCPDLLLPGLADAVTKRFTGVLPVNFDHRNAAPSWSVRYRPLNQRLQQQVSQPQQQQGR